MKKLLLIATLIPTFAYAGDEPFDCSKKHNTGVIHCTAKQDNVAVDSITLHGGGSPLGGECASPVDTKLHHKVMMKGDKFDVPGSKECQYVSGMSIKTHHGKTQHFHAM